MYGKSWSLPFIVPSLVGHLVHNAEGSTAGLIETEMLSDQIKKSLVLLLSTGWSYFVNFHSRAVQAHRNICFVAALLSVVGIEHQRRDALTSRKLWDSSGCRRNGSRNYKGILTHTYCMVSTAWTNPIINTHPCPVHTGNVLDLCTVETLQSRFQ